MCKRFLLQVLKFFGSDSPLDLGTDRSSLTAAAELECALVEHVYNSPQTALGHLQAAGLALGMQTTVEGESILPHLMYTLPSTLPPLLLCCLLLLYFCFFLFSCLSFILDNCCIEVGIAVGLVAGKFPHFVSAQCLTSHLVITLVCRRRCLSATGAMGMRTAHQVDAKAQLIVSTSHSAENDGYTSGEDSSALDAMSLGSQSESSELKGLTTDSDVLSAPRMVNGLGGAAERPLGGLEQAVLLGWAQQVKKGTSADELQVWVACADSSRV